VIRDVNEKVGKLASDLLAEAAKRCAPRHVEHPKRRSAGAGAS